PELGEVAGEIRRHGVQVTDRLASLGEAPEIIHGHYGNSLEAFLHFPITPAVWVCHGWMGQPNEPFFFPRIMRYVGVDEPCARRIREQVNIPPSRIAIKLNAVDTRRFRPRGPLPERPRRDRKSTRLN